MHTVAGACVQSDVIGALLAILAMPPTCLPTELGEAPAPVAVSVPAPAAPPGPAAQPASPLRPAPLAMNETARYRIAYGVLDVGEVSLALEADARQPLLRARGEGAGSLLGLGRLETRVETEFDPTRLASRRWTTTRVRDGTTVLDRIEQSQDGRLAMARSRQGGAPASSVAQVSTAVLDPVSLLLRLRASPPGIGMPPLVLTIIDGQALWRVTLVGAGLDMLGGERPALRLQGQADPILADGRPDGGDRPQRSFRLWLSDDPTRVPLRLEMSIGPADLVVSLKDVKRQPPGARPSAPWWRALGRRLAPRVSPTL